MTNQNQPSFRRKLFKFLLITIPLGLVLFLVTIQGLHSSSDPSFCAKCHHLEGYGVLAEVDSWEKSAHGKAGVSCLDCHARVGMVEYMKTKLKGAKDAIHSFFISEDEMKAILEERRHGLVSQRVCLHCHSDESTLDGSAVFSAPLTGRLADKVKNPEFREHHGLPDILKDNFVGGTHFDHARHMRDFEFTCASCHFGVVHDPRTKRETKEFCLDCHSQFVDRGAPQLENCTVCHEAQLGMNEGTGAIGLTGDPGFMHEAEVGCVDCHTDTMEGFYRPPQDICLNCHDESYMDILSSWKEDTGEALKEAEALRAEAASLLKAADKLGRNTELQWKMYERSLYNLNLVQNDATLGVHNFAYANDIILEDVKKEFTQLIEALERN